MKLKNSKTQNGIKLKNSDFEETKTQVLMKLKTQIVMKLKNSDCDEIQKHNL